MIFIIALLLITAVNNCDLQQMEFFSTNSLQRLFSLVVLLFYFSVFVFLEKVYDDKTNYLKITEIQLETVYVSALP